MTFSGHATIFSRLIITTSCCSVVWLGLVMIRCSVGLVSGYAHAFILLSVVIFTLPISPRVYMAEVQVCYGRWWWYRHSSNLVFVPYVVTSNRNALSVVLSAVRPQPETCSAVTRTSICVNVVRTKCAQPQRGPGRWRRCRPCISANCLHNVALTFCRWLIIIESDVDIACRTGGNIFVRKFIKKWLTSWRITHFPLQLYRYDNIILDTRALPLKISVTVTVTIWFQMRPLQRDRRHITLLM